MSDLFIDKRARPIFIQGAVDDMKELDAFDMRIYMHLARRADNKDGKAWPSYQSMGDHCFGNMYKHPDTRRKLAMKCVTHLITAGLLGKERRINEHGNQTNVYALLDPPVGINTSQPVGINGSLPVGINRSPKGTPIEGTPIEGKEGGAPQAHVAAQAPADPAPPAEVKQKAAPKQKTSSPYAEHPLIQSYRALYEHYPRKAQMKKIVESNPPLDNWIRAINTWSDRGSNPLNIEGQLEWAHNPKLMDRPARTQSKGVTVPKNEALNHDQARIEQAREFFKDKYPPKGGSDV